MLSSVALLLLSVNVLPLRIPISGVHFSQGGVRYEFWLEWPAEHLRGDVVDGVRPEARKVAVLLSLNAAMGLRMVTSRL